MDPTQPAVDLLKHFGINLETFGFIQAATLYAVSNLKRRLSFTREWMTMLASFLIGTALYAYSVPPVDVATGINVAIVGFVTMLITGGIHDQHFSAKTGGTA